MGLQLTMLSGARLLGFCYGHAETARPTGRCPHYAAAPNLGEENNNKRETDNILTLAIHLTRS